jgi:hypothetical protein
MANSKATIAIFFIWSVACLLSGALIGFLFGIPKISQIDPNLKSSEAAQPYRQFVNTNLEKVSDWLTTIIVGLGLYQLSKIPGHLVTLADLLSTGVGASTYRAFSLALIVYFMVVGFLSGYLATRLFLARLFWQADQATTEEVVDHIKATAQTVSPELLSEVLSKAPTEAIIKGEDSFQSDRDHTSGVEMTEVDDESHGSPEEQADFANALEGLSEKTKE